MVTNKQTRRVHLLFLMVEGAAELHQSRSNHLIQTEDLLRALLSWRL